MTNSGRGRPGGLAMKVAVAIALCILIGLGVWQLQRLAWKETLLAHVEALKTAPPEPLSVVAHRFSDGVDVDYVRVQADCPDLEARPYLRLHAVHDGVLGYRLIAACPVSAGPFGSILVDRGFVATEAAASVRPVAEPLSQPLTGVLRKGDPRNAFTPANRPGENLWYGRDIPAMAAALHVSAPAPVFLMLESPAPRTGAPVPAAVPTDIPNRHLEYALTWFGLALALAGVYIARLLSDRRART